jgi:hypothetical protein
LETPDAAGMKLTVKEVFTKSPSLGGEFDDLDLSIVGAFGVLTLTGLRA